MIYLFLANGFEEIEALAVVDILRRADLDVTTVGIAAKQITGSHGISVIADKTDSEVSTQDMQMVILPGGLPGATNLNESPIVQEFLKQAADSEKYIAAICAAPFILGRAGLLKSKKATCYPGYEKELIGAKALSDSVVVDGNIITAKGAGVATEFAFKLVEIMSDKQTADSIRSAMQFV